MLIGEEQYLQPVFQSSVSVVNPSVSIQGKERAYLQIRNRSEINLELQVATQPNDVSVPSTLTLRRDSVNLCQLRSKTLGQDWRKKVAIPCVVKNLLVAPGKGLPVTIEFEVAFTK
jgi:hypothetical protein